MERRLICWACGHEGDHLELASTSSFGPADLDLRPAPMQRNTMRTWAQTCSSCGYVAEDIAISPGDPGTVRRAMAAPKWIELIRQDVPPLVVAFRRLALISQELGQTAAAGEAELWAAWAADDENMEPMAIEYRREAAILMQTAVSQTEMDPQARETTRVRLVDVLRRANKWDDAELLCAELLAELPADFTRSVLQFQVQLIGRRDVACYTLGAIQGDS